MLSSRFTTRGKVALAFSILTGILGVLAVALYGLSADPAAASPAHSQAEHSAGGAAGSVASSSSTNQDNAQKPKQSEVLVTSVSGGGRS